MAHGVGVGAAEGAGPRHTCRTEALTIFILWAQVSLTGSRAQLASGKASLVRKTSFFPHLDLVPENRSESGGV